MRTKGRGSQGYENLVRTKYSGFTVVKLVLEARLGSHGVFRNWYAYSLCHFIWKSACVVQIMPQCDHTEEYCL